MTMITNRRLPMKRIPAGQFKAKCLKLMDEVARTHQPITVTKRGKAVCQFVPMPPEERPFRSVVGRSPNARILGDIISPLPQEWTLPEWMWEKREKSSKTVKRKK